MTKFKYNKNKEHLKKERLLKGGFGKMITYNAESILIKLISQQEAIDKIRKTAYCNESLCPIAYYNDCNPGLLINFDSLQLINNSSYIDSKMLAEKTKREIKLLKKEYDLKIMLGKQVNGVFVLANSIIVSNAK